MLEDYKKAAERFVKPVIDKGFKLEAIYRWLDDNRQPYYRLRCKNPKTGEKWIRPMTMNGNGFELKEPKYKNGKTLYNIETLERKPVDTVYFVEGENKVLALNKLGLLATTSGGASSSNKIDLTPLRMRKVIIWPDNDEPGKNFANEIAEKLKALGCEPLIIDVDKLNLTESQDVVDWLSVNPEATKEDINKLPFLQQDDELKLDTDLNNWPEVLSIEDSSLTFWPDECFPEPIQSYVNALTEYSQTPKELATMIALAVLATASQRKYVVEVIKGHCEHLCLWTCIALPPANRKTSVFENLKKPLDEFVKAQRSIIDPEIVKTKSIIQTKQEAIKEKRRLAAKSVGVRQEELIAEIAKLELNMPRIPNVPQLISSDITPENLGKLMSENQEKMAILSDEGGIFETFAGRYSNGIANLDAALKSHCGSSVTINRQNSSSIHLNQPCLTIGVAVQPEVLKGLSKKDGFRGRGFIGRMLFAVPKSKIGKRKIVGVPIGSEIERHYFEVISNILKIEIKAEEDANKPLIIKFSPEASSLWEEYWQLIESKMKEGRSLSEITDWAGKLPGQIARIAALFHIARYSDDKPENQQISGHDMFMAIQLGDALQQHALIVFDQMNERPEMEYARKLANWIVRESIASFTSREALRGASLKTRDYLDKAVGILEERGWIRPLPKEKVDFRPSDKWEINPKTKK